MSRLGEAWRGRTPRERWLIGIMLALLAAMLAWLLILRPLGDMLEESKARHERAVAELAEARGQAAEIAALERRKLPRLQGEIGFEVGRLAAQAGFQLTRLEPQGLDRAVLSIQAARPQALFAWLGAIETENGLIVERLSATANSDRTLAAELTLRARGR